MECSRLDKSHVSNVHSCEKFEKRYPAASHSTRDQQRSESVRQLVVFLPFDSQKLVSVFRLPSKDSSHRREMSSFLSFLWSRFSSEIGTHDTRNECSRFSLHRAQANIENLSQKERKAFLFSRSRRGSRYPPEQEKGERARGQGFSCHGGRPEWRGACARLEGNARRRHNGKCRNNGPRYTPPRRIGDRFYGITLTTEAAR